MNGTYSSTDTAAMNTHAQQLLAEIDSIASSTKWAGSGLLDGNSAYLNFTTGEAVSSSASLTACIPGFKSANLGPKKSSNRRRWAAFQRLKIWGNDRNLPRDNDKRAHTRFNEAI